MYNPADKQQLVADDSFHDGAKRTWPVWFVCWRRLIKIRNTSETDVLCCNSWSEVFFIIISSSCVYVKPSAMQLLYLQLLVYSQAPSSKIPQIHFINCIDLLEGKKGKCPLISAAFHLSLSHCFIFTCLSKREINISRIFLFFINSQPVRMKHYICSQVLANNFSFVCEEHKKKFGSALKPRNSLVFALWTKSNLKSFKDVHGTNKQIKRPENMHRQKKKCRSLWSGLKGKHSVSDTELLNTLKRLHRRENCCFH